MSTVATRQMVHTAGEALLPDGQIDYDRIISSDGKPVDRPFTEKQMHLLTAPLYACWPGPGDGRPFFVLSDVGLFYAFREHPVVPDVMLGLDVALDPKFKSYFVWEYGKAPDAAIEIVLGTDGEELGRKKRIYQRIGIPYYVVWDPDRYLSEQTLQCFSLEVGKYKLNGEVFREIGLGVAIWHGVYHDLEADWLRWCDEKGNLIATPEEKIAQQQRQADLANLRAEQEKQRAEQEKQRAEQEKQRADVLAKKLRSMGVDPDKP